MTITPRFPATLCLLLCAIHAAAADVLVHNGQKIAFLGDSITAQGIGSPLGYVNEVVSGLAAAGVTVTPIGAGVSGHKSNDMLARIEKDVIDKKPDWMTLSCGVNDVWHFSRGGNGVPLDQYKLNITAIVDKVQKAGIKVILLTATVIGEDLGNVNNVKLADYNEFLRALAKERNLPLADLNAGMQERIKELVGKGRAPGNLLTVDGVHMNPSGNMIMASGILRAFGLDQAQLDKAEAAWLDTPHAVTSQTVEVDLSLRQFQRLQAMADERKVTLAKLLGELLAPQLQPKAR